MQTTTHTVPPNAAPHTIQQISANNIQQQYTRNIASHISSASGYLHYTDPTVITTDPRNQINVSKETNPAPRPPWTKTRGSKLPTPQSTAYVYREQAIKRDY